MSRAPRSRLRTFAGAVRHAIFDESRGGRAAEIAAWSNAASAVVIAAAITAVAWERFAVQGAWAGLAAGALAFAALRLALTHRLTVWIAAIVGTLVVAVGGGGIAWLFAHVVEHPAAPSVAAVFGALVAALAPAWGYSQIARQRASDIRDSLVDPISVPRSR